MGGLSWWSNSSFVSDRRRNQPKGKVSARPASPNDPLLPKDQDQTMEASFGSQNPANMEHY